MIFPVQYRAVDTSPLSIYVIQPAWDFIVSLSPQWVAPNLVTITGWLFILSNFLLLSYYDWDVTATTRNGTSLVRSPIPRWVWLYCSVGHFLGYALDGMDGKQARRTKSSTPVGELFDHGLDSWAAILLPVCLASGFGRWHISASDDFWACVSVLGAFYVSHWEKYVTGIMYLPWLYDIMQLGCGFCFLATGIWGTGLLQYEVLSGVLIQQLLLWVLELAFIGSFPMSLWNIYCHYSNRADPHPRRLSLLQALSPWSAFVVMAMLFWAWREFSLTDIVEKEPRIFYFVLGTVFSNICCRLIISQMSDQPCQLLNPLFLPLLLSISLSFLYPHIELNILWTYFFISLTAHVHYGVSVVQQLCSHFNIYCFSLQKKPQ
jgi:ethanolaminephosphotransferase